ncbi:adaptor protein [Enterococcus phoeniculicola]|uniref:Adapter protein MecA n=1 Tax=Enterococcus phoeniculicola ATCC BAA-412 TaxID=1158610 RepID=R3TT49_9ENTE|nr:adaptor protein MecA [Enterococcus phoeniculicola]EOL44769.1 adaptor protein [Enterococcus phoeniculicola ATCC BAA-412]EOT75058.1 adaptor protein [Enterococcus phoeniculicola ATCC BAA-412]OJG72946.1 adaptor protein [Enterococcus phoeniculicola]
MEMEHINENTIRVLIGNEDLAARGITFLDLLGNHKEIENFFYSILEEVDVEDEFQGSEAVTFQVLPKGDGLELFISKSLSAEELSQLDDMQGSSMDEISEFMRAQSSEDEPDMPVEVESSFQSVIFVLDDFEQMIALSNETFLESAWSNLYRLNESYYLQVNFLMDELSKHDVDDQIAQLLEFAKTTQVTEEVLAEYGELIMERNALELTRFYFK